jgi:hypothetical protein
MAYWRSLTPEWQKYSLDAGSEQLLNSGLLSEDDFGMANEYMTARKEYSAEISAKILESKKERIVIGIAITRLKSHDHTVHTARVRPHGV